MTQHEDGFPTATPRPNGAYAFPFPGGDLVLGAGARLAHPEDRTPTSTAAAREDLAAWLAAAPVPPDTDADRIGAMLREVLGLVDAIVDSAPGDVRATPWKARVTRARDALCEAIEVLP